MTLPAYTPPPREKVTWRTRAERFAAWRRSRPFWAGVFTILAGVEMYSLTVAPLQVVILQGVAGTASIVIFVVFTLLTLVMWAQPQLRVVVGIIVIAMSLASILLTNFGGFLVGMLLGLHGGASMIAWKPFVRRWKRPEPAAPAGPVTVSVARTAAAPDPARAGTPDGGEPDGATADGATPDRATPDESRTDGPGDAAPGTPDGAARAAAPDTMARNLTILPSAPAGPTGTAPTAAR